MKKYVTFALSAISLLSISGLASCSGSKKTIYVGTMSQPGEPILKHIEKEYEDKTGYNLEIQLFTDFATPNNALAQGEIQANLFQHKPFLDTYNENNKTNLASAAIMYDCAYGGYSKKISNLSDLPEGAKITIANDGSNMKRCLDILDAEGLIKVDYGTTATADLNPDTVNSYIVENSKNLVISPIATNLIAASLDEKDVYIGIVNATFAINAGLGSSSNLVCQEQDPTHKNANILACKTEDLKEDWLTALVEVLTSKETDAFITSTFGSTITPYHG